MLSDSLSKIITEQKFETYILLHCLVLYNFVLNLKLLLHTRGRTHYLKLNTESMMLLMDINNHYIIDDCVRSRAFKDFLGVRMDHQEGDRQTLIGYKK